MGDFELFVRVIVGIAVFGGLAWFISRHPFRRFNRLRDKVDALVLNNASRSAFTTTLRNRLPADMPPEIVPAFIDCAERLCAENIVTSPPEPPVAMGAGPKEALKAIFTPGYFDRSIAEHESFYERHAPILPGRREPELETIAASLSVIAGVLPKGLDTHSGFTTRLSNLIPNTPAFYSKVSSPFFTPEALKYDLFRSTRASIRLDEKGNPSLDSFPPGTPLGDLLRS